MNSKTSRRSRHGNYRGYRSEEKATPRFWTQAGYSSSRAVELAQCFVDYWLTRLDDDDEEAEEGGTDGDTAGKSTREDLAIDRAEECLRLLCGDIPKPSASHTDTKPRHDTTKLLKSDPIFWCLKGFELDEAVDKALKFPRPNDRAYQEFCVHDIDYWTLIGHDDDLAMDIAKCYPEYWVEMGYTWYVSHDAADDTLRIRAGLDKSDGGYRDPRKLPRTDPAHWYSKGYDRESATRRAVEMAGIPLPRDWDMTVHKWNLLETLGEPAEPLPDGSIFVSGVCLGDQDTIEYSAEERETRRQDSGEDPIEEPQWGPVCLELDPDGNAHYCAVGVPRVGKSTTLNVLMESLEDCRLVVYDDKTDLLSTIKTVRPKDDIWIFNPFDARTVAWDIASDATHPHIATAIARILIPDSPGQNPYFITTQRTLVATAINALNMAAPKSWTFLHLLAALQLENIETVFSRYESTRRVYDEHLSEGNVTRKPA